MAELLRQGAALTELACPACSSPLVRLKNGNLWCARDEKIVVVVKEGEEPPNVTRSTAFESLETTLMTKVQEIQQKMQLEKDVDQLQKLAGTLSELLDSLEKTRKAKKT